MRRGMGARWLGRGERTQGGGFRYFAGACARVPGMIRRHLELAADAARRERGQRDDAPPSHSHVSFHGHAHGLIPSRLSSSARALLATVPGGFSYQPGSLSRSVSPSRTFMIVNMPPIVM